MNFSSYIMQSFLILGAPPFIAATIYVSLGRIIRILQAEDYAVMGPRKTSVIYILIDVLAFGSQIAGIGLQATGDDKIMKIGADVILAGLIFQLVALVAFVFMTVKLHKQFKRQQTAISSDPTVRWEKYVWGIYIAVTLLFVRNLVRAVQFGQGANGMVSSSEAFIYLFDAVMMWLVLLVVLFLHPGKLSRAVRQREIRKGDAEEISAVNRMIQNSVRLE
jgi:hypothetical protein